jgi:hypothetical protein
MVRGAVGGGGHGGGGEGGKKGVHPQVNCALPLKRHLRRPVQIAEFPTELCPEHCGKGIGMWQLPNQISPTLLFLNQFKIRSYLEVGCAAGGTFMFTTELLRKTNALQGATCVDVAPPGENTHSSTDENRSSPFFGILHEYLKQHSDYASFFVGTSVAYADANPQGPVGGSPPKSVSEGTYLFVTSEDVLGMGGGSRRRFCIQDASVTLDSPRTLLGVVL